MIATGSKTIMNKKPELSKVIHEVEKHFKTKDDYIKKINLDCWNDPVSVCGHQLTIICKSGRHFSLQTRDNILWMKERWNQRIDSSVKVKKF